MFVARPVQMCRRRDAPLSINLSRYRALAQRASLGKACGMAKIANLPKCFRKADVNKVYVWRDTEVGGDPRFCVGPLVIGLQVLEFKGIVSNRLKNVIVKRKYTWTCRLRSGTFCRCQIFRNDNYDDDYMTISYS